MAIEAKGAVLGIVAAATTLGLTFGVSALMRGWTGRNNGPPQVSAVQPVAALASAPLVRGRLLFSQECASCHGGHGQGGAGPDLRRLESTDAQVAVTIKSGMKPGMPAFGSKYGGPDVSALALYVRSLRSKSGVSTAPDTDNTKEKEPMAQNLHLAGALIGGSHSSLGA